MNRLKPPGADAAMYYGWEPLRNIGRPGSLIAAEYISARSFAHTDAMLTDRAIQYIKFAKPDFVFLYMFETDEKGGHDCGWMSDTYFDDISRAIDNAKRMIEEFENEYSIIITADHGGHDRCHGTDMPEDMTIPMFFHGTQFKPNAELKDV